MDARETNRTIDIYVSPRRRSAFHTGRRRSAFHTGNLIDFPLDFNFYNIAPVTTLDMNHVIRRKLQYAMVKANRIYIRISFAIGWETHTICLYMAAIEQF